MNTQQKRPIRVLVVDDDPTYRRILTTTFERIEGVELVGTAATLAIARSKLETREVDLVTLDVVLKDESGLELLPWMRERFPHVITVLLTAGLAQEARVAVDALLLGASSLILKPTGPGAQQTLTDALALVLRGVPARAFSPAPQRAADFVSSGAALREVIAIGASTGGPPVVMQFLKELPANFEVPILITQHMPALHVPYFAELLGRQTGRAVRLAAHGDFVERGGVYIAGDAKHMKITRALGRLVILQDDGPQEHNCRPAVDPLFRSVAESCGAAAVGVVMTGMGSDGALGAVAMRARGAPVVAQDRETSVVWGMPGAVAAAGAASQVVPASALATTMLRWTSGWKSPQEGARS